MLAHIKLNKSFYLYIIFFAVLLPTTVFAADTRQLTPDKFKSIVLEKSTDIKVKKEAINNFIKLGLIIPREDLLKIIFECDGNLVKDLFPLLFKSGYYDNDARESLFNNIDRRINDPEYVISLASVIMSPHYKKGPLGDSLLENAYETISEKDQLSIKIDKKIKTLALDNDRVLFEAIRQKLFAFPFCYELTFSDYTMNHVFLQKMGALLTRMVKDKNKEGILLIIDYFDSRWEIKGMLNSYQIAILNNCAKYSDIDVKTKSFKILSEIFHVSIDDYKANFDMLASKEGSDINLNIYNKAFDILQKTKSNERNDSYGIAYMQCFPKPPDYAISKNAREKMLDYLNNTSDAGRSFTWIKILAADLSYNKTESELEKTSIIDCFFKIARNDNGRLGIFVLQEGFKNKADDVRTFTRLVEIINDNTLPEEKRSIACIPLGLVTKNKKSTAKIILTFMKNVNNDRSRYAPVEALEKLTSQIFIEDKSSFVYDTNVIEEAVAKMPEDDVSKANNSGNVK